MCDVTRVFLTSLMWTYAFLYYRSAAMWRVMSKLVTCQFYPLSELEDFSLVFIELFCTLVICNITINQWTIQGIMKYMEGPPYHYLKEPEMQEFNTFGGRTYKVWVKKKSDFCFFKESKKIWTK